MILHFRILFRSLCVGQWRRFRAYAMKERRFPCCWVWLESGILRRILIPRTYRWVWVWVVTRHVIKQSGKEVWSQAKRMIVWTNLANEIFMPRTEKEITTLTVGQVLLFFFRSQFFIFLFLAIELSFFFLLSRSRKPSFSLGLSDQSFTPTRNHSWTLGNSIFSFRSVP